ncbi:unnamed protein product [Cylindrotheca closterium]|uniref:Uncharacterized protein n=1 Tax=Cylindrotheca closterium TaxID=2856 RepID=A0AAD2G893_9STRA|nr:unnamed protein product [Cylindrotheca closterium]
MPVSIQKFMTRSLETVQEWYALPTPAASTSSALSAGTTVTTRTSWETQSSDSNKNQRISAAHDDSLQAPPRKGSWDNSFMPAPLDNKEERDLESMIQCTSTFF